MIDGGNERRTGQIRRIDLVAADMLVRSHIDRQLIVRTMKAGGAEEMSAKQLAVALGKEISNISHHVKSLARGGVLEKTREEQVRGALATFYRLNPDFLHQVPDGVVLDELAEYLRGCNGSADVDTVREFVMQTGRPVARNGAGASTIRGE